MERMATLKEDMKLNLSLKRTSSDKLKKMTIQIINIPDIILSKGAAASELCNNSAVYTSIRSSQQSVRLKYDMMRHNNCTTFYYW